MSAVLVIGDGPLAHEFAALAQNMGHSVIKLVYGQEEPEIDLLTVNLTVEAVIADRRAKKEAIQYLNRVVGADTPILAATLNASATEVSSWIGHSERVVGWAALPPVSVSGVVEFMPGLLSGHAAVDLTRDFLASLSKEPVTVKDTLGGVLPRVVVSLINSAAYAVMEGVATPEDIDLGMKLGTNYPHGPLAWGDRIGLDQVVGILDALSEVYGAERYRPAPLLRQLVQAGFCGEYAGRGFYQHRADR